MAASESVLTRTVAASAIGLLTGLFVLALELVVGITLGTLLDTPPWVLAIVVTAGMILTAIVTHYLGGRSSETTEAYIRDFHSDEPVLRLRHVPGRVLAAFTTLGSGIPLGMEGPAVYAGSVVAELFRRLWPRMRPETHHALLIAAAAAGIAAVFKSPVAGAIFAVEVPSRSRLANERVLPAIFGAGVGYFTMATVQGVKPEFEQLPSIDLNFASIVHGLLLGVVVGVVARGVIWLVREAEETHERWPAWGRALVAGVALAGMYAAGHSFSGEPLALTSGKLAIEWAVQPDRSLGLLAALLALRAIGPAIAIAGSGVGGLFIPLLAVGAVVGQLFSEVASFPEPLLLALVGGACMLGAGYAVPLTGVVFVAEITGESSVIVPGLLAMAATLLVVGDRSVSAHQIP